MKVKEKIIQYIIIPNMTICCTFRKKQRVNIIRFFFHFLQLENKLQNICDFHGFCKITPMCQWMKAWENMLKTVVRVCKNSPNESSLLPLGLAAPVVQLQLSCPGQKSWAVCFLAPQGEVSVSPSKLQGGGGDKQEGLKNGCVAQSCGIISVVTRVRRQRPAGQCPIVTSEKTVEDRWTLEYKTASSD